MIACVDASVLLGIHRYPAAQRSGAGQDTDGN